MTSMEIVSHAFNGVQVRAEIDEHGDPWFIAADVCRVLEHTNPTMAVAALDDDEKGLSNVETPGGAQLLVSVSEAGLYSLILRSRKPEAKAFKRWITHEVLPSIRHTGQYVAESPEQLMARALVQAQQTLEQSAARIAELEPRAEAWNAIASAEGDYSVGDAAKILARAGIPTGPTRLFTQLRDLKWTYRGADGAWRAYAERVESGHLAEKPQFHYHPSTGERVLDAPQVRVTVKGLERLRLRLHVGKAVA
ncbi:phage antirepressor KilAC domain-containing protein [Agromyces aureus]|uniref:Bro-N domain-containing protein n=1 Tax=Agromyces aureus TaxID=453304 RepID=A0A191WEU4_9MICO|nr:phage antirepressor KilAC domain-containing protein [Agromyces aureus]ANJ26781.1 hypothetical protein ATC03_08710 [Agromyces aureus]